MIDGVAVTGDLDLTGPGSQLTVRNGLTLNGTAWVGHPTGATAGGLYFDGTQTLGGSGAVVFGRNDGNSLRTLNATPDDPAACVLTIGPGITIRGSAGTIGDGYHPATIVNQGTIAADDSGGASTFSYDTGFSGGYPDSTGAPVIDTSAVTDPAPQVVYQTSRYAAYELSYTLLGFQPGVEYLVRLHFSEAGVQLNPGDRRFDVEANGTVMVSGLDVVAAAGGTNRAIVRAFTAAADGDGRIVVRLVHTVTADPYVIINAIEVRSGGTVVRAIDAGLVGGGAITLNPGRWRNTGTITAAAGEVLNLGGSFATADVGTVNSTGGAVNLVGTLENADATLALTAATGSWSLLGGTIHGGRVAGTGGAQLILTNSGGTLDGVTFDADVDGTRYWGGSATVLHGLTLNGTARLGATNNTAWGLLTFVGDQTLGGGGQVLLQGSLEYNALIARDVGTTLTIGPGITVRGDSGTVGNHIAWGGQGAVVNRGLITAETSGQAITLKATPFRNEGSVVARNGAVLRLDGVVSFESSSRLAGDPSTAMPVLGDVLGSGRNADLFAPQGVVRFQGPGTAAAPQRLEVMGEDRGRADEGFGRNFAYGSLALANGTYLKLVDLSDNSGGPGAESLYVTSLVVPLGTTLDLNGLHLYTRLAQIGGTILGGSIDQILDSGPITLGVPTPGTISLAGERDEWTFFDRGGRSVTVVVNAGTSGSSPALSPALGYVEVQLVDAANHVLASASNTGYDTIALTDVALPADGVYRILVRASVVNPASTGNYTVGVWDVTADVAPVVFNQRLVGRIENPYSVDRYTFTAAANRVVSFNLLGLSAAGLAFDLKGPNGWVGFQDLATDSGLITLPFAGGYTLTAHGTNGRADINYSFRLDDIVITDLTLNTPFSGTIIGAGQTQIFKVHVPTGTPLRVTLDDASTVNYNSLYVSYGAPTTLSRFEYGGEAIAFRQLLAPGVPPPPPPVNPDRQELIDFATPGDWYVVLYTLLGQGQGHWPRGRRSHRDPKAPPPPPPRSNKRS